MENKQWVDMDILEAYLDGTLDAKTMHQVEKISLDDPFMADALEGLSQSKLRKSQLSLLQKRLQQRVTQKPQTRKLWRLTTQRLGIAATAAVLFVTASLFFIMKNKQSKKLADGRAKGPVEIAFQSKKQSVGEQAKADKVEERIKQAIAENKDGNVAKAAADTSSLTQKQASSANSSTSASVAQNARVVKELRAGQAIAANRIADERQNAEAINQILKSKAIDIRMPVKLSNDREVIKGKVKPLQDASELMVGAGAKNQNDFYNDKVGLAQVVAYKGEVEAKGRLGATDVFISSAPLIGWEAFETYLLENNRLINETPTGNTVQLSFIVKKNGNPSRIKVVKSVDKASDNEAVRLLKSGGKWTYGSGSINKATVTVLF